ncbi:TPA: hypothetical protein ACNP37_004108, partial [Raoultella ornithinolytica]
AVRRVRLHRRQRGRESESAAVVVICPLIRAITAEKAGLNARLFFDTVIPDSRRQIAYYSIQNVMYVR